MLLNFFVRRMLPAPFAELLELKTSGRGLLVLGRRVVPLFAVAALKCDYFSHDITLFARLEISNLKFQIANSSYWMISLIVPAPTVLPPSRIANRSPFSIATGVISSIVNATLSPGITISVPLGSSATPVTSVVRK